MYIKPRRHEFKKWEFWVQNQEYPLNITGCFPQTKNKIKKREEAGVIVQQVGYMVW